MPGSLGPMRVTPDHPPGVIPCHPRAGDPAHMAKVVPPENAAPPSGASGHWRLRRATLVLLLVLGCGLAAASAIAIWTRVTVLNTDRYVKTMAPIARSAPVQKTVADKLYTRITGAIDFDALARDVLPDRADVLAPAIEVGAETAIREGLDRFVASDRFGEVWDAANRRAHETVVALLTTGKSNRLTLDGNVVYLDMSQVVDRLKDRLRERGFGRVADAIPANIDGRIPLLTSDGFSTARHGVNVLKGLSWVLPLLALLCLAGHILLTRPRRRGWLRVALGLAVTGLLLLALVGIGRTYYLDSINRAVLPKDAAEAIFDALIALLRDSLRLAVVAAIVMALLSLLAGKPARLAVQATGPRVRAARERLAADPRTSWVAEHRAAVQWSVVLLGGLVLVVWRDPTAWTVLIDAALIVLAVWIVAALSRGAARPAG
jgi:hypothetical protein